MSLMLINQHLCNIGLEGLFFGLWGASSSDAAVTVSIAFAAGSHIDLQLFSELSELPVLSADALDCLLSSTSFVIDSDDETCCSGFR
jgi:hypothetical protein